MSVESSDRWTRVEQILDAALELPLEQRAAYLDQSCGDDASLREEVTRLLRSCDDPGHFLAEPVVEFAALVIEEVAAAESALPSALVAALSPRYVLERELARGSPAAVYLARDTRHDRAVAIKVLRLDVPGPLGAERFLREIRITAGLQHPHILPLHDSGEIDGAVYYVMPYVRGESLRDRLLREKRLPVPEALRIAREIADALAYAHRQGIVHRDIKPENVLLQEEHAQVADFGIARAIRYATETRFTANGLALGTPAYMSPEQAAGEDELDGRSDIYSLGCVLYEMLTGELPFRAESVQALLARHISEPPPSVRAARPDAPPNVEDALRVALAKEPAHRFQTADAFERALVATPDTLGRRWRRRTLVAGAATVGGLVLIGGTAMMLRRPRPPLDPAATVIAVMPFAPTTPDTGLFRLGRDLAIALSADLDGVGNIHVIDALTILAQTGETTPTPDRAHEISRRFGASSVITGTIMRVGGQVRLDAALAPTSTSAAEALARASATAAPEQIGVLADSTVWSLLRQVWQSTAPPTPVLAAITTRSIPALRAFLEGERLVVAGHWKEAPDAYLRAMALDSTFWMAYWRYAFARSFYGGAVDPAIVAGYRDHRASFPERERLLIEASQTDSLTQSYELVKRATELYPDYWPAWWTLSEDLTHTRPLFGSSAPDLRAALERTVTLNPRLMSGWDHLFWVGLWQRDTLLTRRVLSELTALHFDSISLAESGHDALAEFRYYDALARSGGRLRDESFALPGVAHFQAWKGPFPMDAVAFTPAQYSFPQAQIDFARMVLTRPVPPDVANAFRYSIAIGQAARGAWDSSLVTLDTLVAATSGPLLPLCRYRIAVVGAWLSAVDPATAAAKRAAVAREATQLPDSSRAELAWLDGLLAATRQDATALAAARRALRGTDSVAAPFLERSLSALQLALSGASSRAADSLVTLEHQRAEFGWSRWHSDGHPFLTAVNRLAAARWLRERGDAARAAPLLTWHEGIPWPMRSTRMANVVIQGLAYLEQARVARALGRDDLARTYYQYFLWRYDAPVPAHRQLVEEAERALTRFDRREKSRQ